MAKLINMIGQKIGKLTVIKLVKKQNNSRAYWLCKCDCGNETVVCGKDLRNGNTKSCGCLNQDKIIEYNKKQRKLNNYEELEDCYICHTDNGDFYFDKSDYSYINNIHRCWYIHKTGYVLVKLNGVEVRLQNYLMHPPEGHMVDHIDGNPLNNRRSNLRICKEIDNAKNKKTPTNNTSGVKGVSWNNKMEQWCARIGYNNERILLGYFNNFDEAVKTRKEAEIEYHKEFSNDR
jgi:hypothetical protein